MDVTYDISSRFKIMELCHEEVKEKKVIPHKFPFDFRYIRLIDENLTEKQIKEVINLYTDEELDLLIDILEGYKYKDRYEFFDRCEDEIFNDKNDEKVLNLCLKEYKNRF